MRLRPIILSPFLRCCAAAALVAWVGAQALCQMHCVFGACHDEPEDTVCHSTAAEPHHGDDDHGPQPCGHGQGADASCLTLNSALTGNAVVSVATPQLFPLYDLAPFKLPLDVMTSEAVARFSRQAGPPDWVFTPEVCLGPAFRSHAPPFSSLA